MVVANFDFRSSLQCALKGTWVHIFLAELSESSKGVRRWPRENAGEMSWRLVGPAAFNPWQDHLMVARSQTRRIQKQLQLPSRSSVRFRATWLISECENHWFHAAGRYQRGVYVLGVAADQVARVLLASFQRSSRKESNRTLLSFHGFSIPKMINILCILF